MFLHPRASYISEDFQDGWRFSTSCPQAEGANSEASAVPPAWAEAIANWIEFNQLNGCMNATHLSEDEDDAGPEEAVLEFTMYLKLAGDSRINTPASISKILR